MEDLEIIFDKFNHSEYLTVLKKHGIISDIYFDLDFLAADAILQGGDYEIYFLEKGGRYFIYPYIKVPFEFKEERYYDLISPYGYAGPVGNDESFFNHAEERFLAYIRGQRNIITEFVRYHYLYNEERKFTIDIDNIKNREVVVLHLDDTWDTIFKNDFSPTAKNLVRKLERQGYRFEIDSRYERIDDFIKLYYSNMDYTSAERFYYFPRGFFYNLKEHLGDRMILAHVVKDDVIYCSSLFLLHSGIITYYLSGRNTNYNEVPSNYFILSSAVKWGIANNFRLFNFGGGRTIQPDDNLLKFKSHFSKKTKPFYIGKRIHNTDLLDQIKQDFIENNGEEEFLKKRHLLQFYR